MRRVPISALVLATVCASTLAIADSGAQDRSTSPDDIIYDLSVPWPFRHGRVPGDADGDGVADVRDACPGTPRGAVVDANGCPMDSDGDGVPDGVDRCDATPKGASVDRYGCPVDSDGDGVADGRDRCERTPKGAVVDANGCPVDSDGDGVPDGIDQCAGTSRELAVDKKGCPIPIGEVAERFLEEDAVAFNIAFASGKADIEPSSYESLNQVGEVLTEWLDAEVEVAGHTDSQGSEAYNRTLSQRRAESVKAYLTRKFPKVRAQNLKPKGYGEGRPVATNDTPEGRAKNRRVEFTLLNSDELKKTIDMRRFKKRGE